jgi:hypothetical protein
MYGQWHMACHSSQAAMVGALMGGAVCFGLMPGAFAQEAQTNRLVGYISPSLLSSPVTPDSSTETNVDANTAIAAPSWSEILKPNSRTPGDRLVSFEQEYGMDQESGSPFGRVLQVAKYGLDQACFTVQEAARKLEFKYDTADAASGVLGGDAGNPQYSLPVFGRFSHAQLQTVVKVHDPQTGQAFMGVKLTVPFGPGG